MKAPAALTALLLMTAARAGAESTGPVRAKSPPQKPTLDCSVPQSIRDFKDSVLLNIDPGPKAAEEEAACLCGKAAAKAGRNQTAPSVPDSVPKHPGFTLDDMDASIKVLAKWYLRNLPVEAAQAARLSRCAHDRLSTPTTDKKQL